MSKKGAVMSKSTKIDYDKENDLLFAYTGEKINDSLEIGDFIIDFSNQNKIVGLEILDVSQMLKMSNMPASNLESIVGGKISLSQTKNSIYIMLVLEFKMGQKIEEREICITVPRTVERVVS